MTKLLDKAIDAARRLDPADQDEIARTMMALLGEEQAPCVPLSAAECAAIAASKSASARGEFATDEQVRAVWAKHGL